MSAGYLQLAAAVFRKELLLLVRYPMNFAGRIIVFLMMFGIIFYGGRAVGGAAFSDSVAGILVGYFLWMMASTMYSDLAMSVRAEAEWGTLERHFITPFGFRTVLFVKAVARLIITFLLGTSLLFVMMALSGEWLSLDFLTIVPVLVFTLASITGFGFAMGGLTVLYKQIGSWVGLLQFAFVGLIAAPSLGYGWTALLPLAHGSALLQQAMTEGVRLWEFSALDLGLLVVTGVGYLLVGAVVFGMAQTRARKLGVLGHY
ncbi:ABC transporter permease [Halobacteriales archaeon QS_1_68_20]|nr:MAG: ABC transporter permease [Halobacteriales archaeon QS_1_68_20]